jgi:hypothetical protein
MCEGGVPMKKVVIDADYGGFSLSRKAFLMLRELKHPDAMKEPDIGEAWPGTNEVRKEFLSGNRNPGSFCRDIKRDDPLLIQVVEHLGKEANGDCASLRIISIPEDVKWTVEEYDGREWIAEEHRTWS